MLSQAELQTEGSRFATIFGLSPTPRQRVYFWVFWVIFESFYSHQNKVFQCTSIAFAATCRYIYSDKPYIYMYIYIFIRMHLYIYTCLRVFYTCLYVCMYMIKWCVYLHIFIYTCIYVHLTCRRLLFTIHVNTSTCIYNCVYIHI